MTKIEMLERIEELENEIEELEEQIERQEHCSKYDKAAKDAAYVTMQMINAFREEGLTKDQAYEMTKLMIKGAIA